MGKERGGGKEGRGKGGSVMREEGRKGGEREGLEREGKEDERTLAKRYLPTQRIILYNSCIFLLMYYVSCGFHGLHLINAMFTCLVCVS